MTLFDYAKGRDNNFNLIRVIAAADRAGAADPGLVACNTRFASARVLRATSYSPSVLATSFSMRRSGISQINATST